MLVKGKVEVALGRAGSVNRTPVTADVTGRWKCCCH